jgi:hypothetical protein
MHRVDIYRAASCIVDLELAGFLAHRPGSKHFDPASAMTSFVAYGTLLGIRSYMAGSRETFKFHLQLNDQYAESFTMYVPSLADEDIRFNELSPFAESPALQAIVQCCSESLELHVATLSSKNREHIMRFNQFVAGPISVAIETGLCKMGRSTLCFDPGFATRAEEEELALNFLAIGQVRLALLSGLDPRLIALVDKRHLWAAISLAAKSNSALLRTAARQAITPAGDRLNSKDLLEQEQLRLGLTFTPWPVEYEALIAWCDELAICEDSSSCVQKPDMSEVECAMTVQDFDANIDWSDVARWADLKSVWTGSTAIKTSIMAAWQVAGVPEGYMRWRASTEGAAAGVKLPTHPVVAAMEIAATADL